MKEKIKTNFKYSVRDFVHLPPKYIYIYIVLNKHLFPLLWLALHLSVVEPTFFGLTKVGAVCSDLGKPQKSSIFSGPATNRGEGDKGRATQV